MNTPKGFTQQFDEMAAILRLIILIEACSNIIVIMGNISSFYSQVDDSHLDALSIDESEIKQPISNECKTKQQKYEEALAAYKNATTIPGIHEAKKTYKEALITNAMVEEPEAAPQP